MPYYEDELPDDPDAMLRKLVDAAVPHERLV
jgi:hypothetical protein